MGCLITVGFNNLRGVDDEYQYISLNMDGFDYKSTDTVVKPERKSKYELGSSSFLVLVLILLFIIVGLVVFISLTYVLNLQCDKDKKGPATSDNSLSFLLFSDIHLDPFYKETAASKNGFCRNESMPSSYKATYGRVGCDSPITLLRNVLVAMKNQSKYRKVEFILLSGDTCAHRMTSRTNVLNIIKNSSEEIALVFPSIPYFPSIGNNDLPGHYVIPGPNDSWYSDLLDIWQDAILCTKCKTKHNITTKDELRRTFLNGGYYKASITDGTMTLLVLNSMYWTYSTWKPYSYFTEIAQTQMDWLKDQLDLSRRLKRRVIITSHIPPGIDPYLSNQGYKVLWLSNFTKLYVDLVANQYSDVVAGQVYAHFHKDSFRFIHDEKRDPLFDNSSFILLTPSLSVVYKNNPSFRVVHLDPDLQALTDYEQYYMNLVLTTEFDNPVWQLDYRFSEKYPPTGIEDKVINGMRIKKLGDNMINQTNNDVFTGFIISRQVRYQPDPFSRFVYYCGVRFCFQEDFNACHKKYIVPGG